MAVSTDGCPFPKVYYSPVEAAIRWTGLSEYESRIHELLVREDQAPESAVPRWQAFTLNLERIQDAVARQELAHTLSFNFPSGPHDAERPVVRIRHSDLRAWISQHFPSEEDHFPFEHTKQSEIFSDALRAVLAERDALKVLVTQPRESRGSHDPSSQGMSARSERTYLNIIGVLLEIFFGRSPSGQPYSRFTTQESLIDTMVATHGELLGISVRTLQEKFADANRVLSK